MPEPIKLNSISSFEALLTATRRFARVSFSHSREIARGERSNVEWHLLWALKNWPDPKAARPSELAKLRG
jgi:hypothetical protein